MCHWVLRIWQCGESYFTKHSSCSFDRAAHCLNNPLNPLHASITPLSPDKLEARSCAGLNRPLEGPKQLPYAVIKNAPTEPKHKPTSKPRGDTAQLLPHNASFAKSASPAIGCDSSSATILVSSAEVVMAQSPHNTNLEEMVPGLSLSDIGRASRWGDNTLGTRACCDVFEVVLQRRELTICPACARSPRRAKLPARKFPSRLHSTHGNADLIPNFRCERMLCTELNAGDPAELGNVVGLSASGVGQ